MKGFDTFFDYYLHIRKAREEEEDISFNDFETHLSECNTKYQWACCS